MSNRGETSGKTTTHCLLAALVNSLAALPEELDEAVDERDVWAFLLICALKMGILFLLFVCFLQFWLT